MTKPAAVITTLEDSPQTLDQSLVDAFLRTAYTVPGWGLRFRIGQLNPLLAGWLSNRSTHTFAFLTAWNPRSEQQPASVNRARQQALAAALTRRSVPYWPALHLAEDPGAPCEESYWIENIAADLATGLSRRFRQNALVFWQAGGVPELWWTS